jgi:hypothetical protein
MYTRVYMEIVEEKQRSGSGDILEITNSWEFRTPGPGGLIVIRSAMLREVIQ